MNQQKPKISELDKLVFMRSWIKCRLECPYKRPLSEFEKDQFEEQWKAIVKRIFILENGPQKIPEKWRYIGI